MTEVTSSDSQSETKIQFPVLLSSGNGLQERRCTSQPDPQELILLIKGEGNRTRRGGAAFAEENTFLCQSNPPFSLSGCSPMWVIRSWMTPCLGNTSSTCAPPAPWLRSSLSSGSNQSRSAGRTKLTTFSHISPCASSLW